MVRTLGVVKFVAEAEVLEKKRSARNRAAGLISDTVGKVCFRSWPAKEAPSRAVASALQAIERVKLPFSLPSPSIDNSAARVGSDLVRRPFRRWCQCTGAGRWRFRRRARRLKRQTIPRQMQRLLVVAAFKAARNMLSKRVSKGTDSVKICDKRPLMRLSPPLFHVALRVVVQSLTHLMATVLSAVVSSLTRLHSGLYL